MTGRKRKLSGNYRSPAVICSTAASAQTDESQENDEVYTHSKIIIRGSFFSTSVELQSENVCVSVCVCVRQKLWGSLWRLQKCSDLAEILHTWSLGKYMGVFFSFFENFDFWGLGTS